MRPRERRRRLRPTGCADGAVCRWKWLSHHGSFDGTAQAVPRTTHASGRPVHAVVVQPVGQENRHLAIVLEADPVRGSDDPQLHVDVPRVGIRVRADLVRLVDERLGRLFVEVGDVHVELNRQAEPDAALGPMPTVADTSESDDVEPCRRRRRTSARSGSRRRNRWRTAARGWRSHPRARRAPSEPSNRDRARRRPCGRGRCVRRRWRAQQRCRGCPWAHVRDGTRRRVSGGAATG